MRFILSSIFIFALVVSGCAPVEMEKVVVQRADQYRFTLQQQGLRVSVDPYTEDVRLRESFGCDLLSRGILPVLVVFENLSSEDGYIIVSDKSGLVLVDATIGGEKASEDQMKKELKAAGTMIDVSTNIMGPSVAMPQVAAAVSNITTGSTSLMTAAPMLSIVGLVATIPIAVAAENKYRDEIAIKKNLEQKQLRPKTLYQGSSHSGFLYFNLGTAESLNKVKGICLRIKNIRTSEISSFTINMDKI